MPSDLLRKLGNDLLYPSRQKREDRGSSRKAVLDAYDVARGQYDRQENMHSTLPVGTVALFIHIYNLYILQCTQRLALLHLPFSASSKFMVTMA
jgi:hypothetical protein